MKKLLIAALFFTGCAPLKEFRKIPAYAGESITATSKRYYSPKNKNVFILADNNGTEIFDLVAPFYLFNLTGKANVYIIARESAPVSLMKGFFMLPHYTYRQADSIGLSPSAIIIPNFSATKDDSQDSWILDWIREKYSDTVSVLSICAGSFTAAATGLYNGKLMTTHASEMAGNKQLFKHAVWVQNVSYTRDGNLYSSAGVSNATEGSLALIKDMFDEATMRDVMRKINYRYDTLKTTHQSAPITSSDKALLLKKVLLRRDKKVGVLLQDGIDEFMLAAILDSYHRTIPASLKTYTNEDAPIITRYGLVLLPTGKVKETGGLTEMHVIGSGEPDTSQNKMIGGRKVVGYDPRDRRYIFDICLERIRNQYGQRFEYAVKRLLDYN